MAIFNGKLTKLTALLSAALLVTACSSSTTESSSELSGSLEPVQLAEKTKITVAIPSVNEVYGQVLVAIANGEFEKENLEVEIVTLPSPDAVPALVDGSIDVAVGVLGATQFNAIAQGAEIRMVLTGGNTPAETGLWVRKELLAGAPASLKGKTIAATYGWNQPSMSVVKDYLATGGVTPDDVNVELLQSADAALALDEGSIDAAWVTNPSYLPLKASGNASKVVGYIPDQISTGYYFGDRLLNKNPEIGQAFVRAIMRTTKTYLSGDYKNDPELGPMVAETLGLTLEELKYSESIVFEFYTQEELSGELTDLFTSAQEMWLDFGDILVYDIPLTAQDYADMSFIERILSENDL